MKISLEILYRETLDFFPELILTKGAGIMEFIGVCSVTDTHIPQPGFILFGKSEQFSPLQEGCSVISIGKIKKEFLYNNNILEYPEDTNRELLLQKILSVFALYDEWDNNLRDAILKEKSLQKIVESSRKIFRNPILIHNANFQILGYTESDYGVHLMEKDIDELPIIASEILNQFKVDKEYQETLKTMSPDIFSDDMFGFRVLYVNLWANNQYYGRICVSELNSSIFHCDKQLVAYMADFVINSILIGQNVLSEKPRSLKKIFSKIINGESIETTLLNKVLESSGWSPGDAYFCCCLFTDQRDIATNTVANTCQTLEAQFPKTCVFSYFNNIVIVVNSSLSGYNIESFSKSLGIYLRECLLKAGLSSMGRDFKKLKSHYLQSVSAFLIGSHKDESFWRFHFDDYVLEYIISQATMEIPGEFISHPGLRILKDYDQTHQGELYRTLELYLENNMNITKTSEDLQIHRTTLLYRIEKISALTKIDFEDPKKRLHILLSYIL